jgi:ParB-like chromosome segregation protein Spo0J
MTLETVHLGMRDLEPHPQNAKQHDMPLLVDSIRTFGQYRTIVVQAPRDGRKKHRVLAGHGTWFAMKEAGLDTVACNVHDVDDETALRIVAIDNRSTELGGWDEEALVQMLASLPDLDHTGYSQKDYDKMVEQLQEDFDDGAPDPELEQRFGVVVELHTEEQQTKVIETLVELGFEPRALFA